jgi:hypothetical protein
MGYLAAFNAVIIFDIREVGIGLTEKLPVLANSSELFLLNVLLQ